MRTTIRPEELVHQATKLDTTYWGSVINKSSSIQQALLRRADRVTGGDIFQALYQWEPELKEGDNSPDQALSAWLAKITDTEAFKSLRATTVGNREVSAGASVTLFRELMRSKESQFKAVQQTKHSIDQMDAMMDGSMALQVKRTIQDAQRQLAVNISEDTPDGEVTARYNGKLTPYADVMAALVHTDETIQMAQDLATFDSGGSGHSLGGVADGHILETLDNALLERITSQDSLRKVFQIAGRMRIILQQAKSRKPRPAPTPVSITTGGELSNVLSSELATISDPETEDKFWAKYLDKNLLQYDHKARMNEGLGPFICLMDMSGSMSGQPLQIAQALYISLARMAVEKQRKIAFIPFASYANKIVEINSSNDLVKSLTTSYRVGSGTDFQSPLELGREYLLKQPKFKLADIILITDGIAHLDKSWIDQFIQDKKEIGFRLVGLNVQGGRYNTWQTNQLPMFDATAHMEDGEKLSELNWLNSLADNLV